MRGEAPLITRRIPAKTLRVVAYSAAGPDPSGPSARVCGVGGNPLGRPIHLHTCPGKQGTQIIRKGMEGACEGQDFILPLLSVQCGRPRSGNAPDRPDEPYAPRLGRGSVPTSEHPLHACADDPNRRLKPGDPAIAYRALKYGSPFPERRPSAGMPVCYVLSDRADPFSVDLRKTEEL
jgi:hypothetical protein